MTEQKRISREGQRMTDEMLLHEPDPIGMGGILAAVFGSRGSGKTAFLANAACKVKYKDPDGNQWNETVLWRGRQTEDGWLALPRGHTTLFVYKDDIGHIAFKTSNGNIPPERMPPVVAYTSFGDLYSKIKHHECNVIYEPSHLTDDVKKDIRRMVGKYRDKEIGEDAFTNMPESVFWFAFINWLIRNKDSKPMTIIFDEADELFQVSPSGVRWYLNLWMKERGMDCRKRNISIFLATHGYQDIDGRILCKFMVKAYLKGITTPATSLIDKHAPLLLDRGVYYIERDQPGMWRLPDMPPMSPVHVIDRGADATGN